MKDKIEKIYQAIDEIIFVDGKPRKKEFGGGNWDAEEEFKIYKKQIKWLITDLQIKIINLYFKEKLLQKRK